MREEWPKSCDVITFCVNRFWGLFGLSFQVESKILLCSPQVYSIQTSTLSSVNHIKHVHMERYGKFGFGNLWLNTLRLVVGHFKVLHIQQMINAAIAAKTVFK